LAIDGMLTDCGSCWQELRVEMPGKVQSELLGYLGAAGRLQLWGDATQSDSEDG
jgi:hypothetical protein